MIIVVLSGGLGNQIFEYSLGKSLAIKYQTNLFLFPGELRKHWLQRFELNKFFLKDCEIISAKKYNSLFKSGDYTIITESTDYKINIDSFQDNIILKGYWQSFHYFTQNRTILLNDLVLKHKISQKSQLIQREINSCVSIAVHIRRGDYVTKKDTYRTYGKICDVEYYSKAINYIQSTLNQDIKLFFFSNDIKWVKENLKVDCDSIYIDHNYKRKHSRLENIFLYRNLFILLKYFIKTGSIEDFELMSNCKHFIIANSSYSWWAAWLGRHNEKIVVAPKKWINNINNDKELWSDEVYSRLIPSSWVKL